jgi:hypothetical protein
MESLQAEEDRLDQELEDSHGEYEKMKTVFERRIQLYIRSLRKKMTELDRLRLENKKEWTMSHLLSLIMHEETTNKFSELTKRTYRIEEKVGREE